MKEQKKEKIAAWLMLLLMTGLMFLAGYIASHDYNQESFVIINTTLSSLFNM